MADEYFFALTLEGPKANEVWDPEARNSDEFQGGHKLMIKQALLGPEAKEGEVNVIQVEAMTWKESIKIPVAVLKAGTPSSQMLLELSFPDPPVTFSLVQGSGPVHLIGHHLIGGPVEEFDEIDDEMEEEMLDEDDGEDGAENNVKRKMSSIQEDEEEDDEEEEGPKSKKAKTNNSSAKGKGSAIKNNKAKK